MSRIDRKVGEEERRKTRRTKKKRSGEVKGTESI